MKNQNRAIRKVAILGAGIMGSRIALHFANIGVEAILLDIVPSELTPEEQKANLTLEYPAVRNRIVSQLFQSALKSNPAPLYDKAFVSRVKLGNLVDNLNWLTECDWIIEAVIERLDIKLQLFEKLENFRKPGSLITTNTSGIPIHLLIQNRSEDFIKHFCGTHFFNPPRYLPLLEIIPSPKTDESVIEFLKYYGTVHLGKKVVICKDTPAFIANRVGIFAIMDLFHLVKKYGLSVEETDALTGPIIGHPKSATFRTCDVVGLETAIKVAQGIGENCKNDERLDVFQIPDYIQYMVDNKLWGEKTGQGFYKRVKNEDGSSTILSLNFQTKQYEKQKKVTSPILEQLKTIESLPLKFKTFIKGNEKYSEFIREASYGLFAYVSNRVPEIADHLYQIDEAISAGFGWEIGAFEQWDILGVQETLAEMQQQNFKVAPWVLEMLEKGFNSFYQVVNGKRQYYDINQKAYLDIPGQQEQINLEYLRATNVVWKNSGATLFDIGDGILNLEFNTKMNTLGGDVLQAIDYSINLAEQSFRGLVIGNQGENFSAGANLALVLMFAVEQEYDELDLAVRTFQRTVQRIRYASVPVVVAPHGLTLGGGCELTLHADSAVAAAETYIGLVEVGVGLIPAGGGTKEMVIRMNQQVHKGDVETNLFVETFMMIATAKVATSAFEALSMNILQSHKDHIVINKARLISEAKRAAIELAEAGYTPPIPNRSIKVLGRTALGLVYSGAYQMQFAGYATEYDRKVAEKLGYVMAGGDLSAPTNVSEQYLLDLEREAFLSLCGERKTLERIEHMLKTGKPLRN